MTNPHTCLARAAGTLSAAVTGKREWPVDLADSAPEWAELWTQLAQVASWVVQGAVVVRDTAETPPTQQGLATTADLLITALTATSTVRPVVDHTWRAVAETFTHAHTPDPDLARAGVREVRVAPVVHDATQAVRQAAGMPLTAEHLIPALYAASLVWQAMYGLVIRIADAVDHRAPDLPGMAGISRSLRHRIHNTYRDASDNHTTATRLCEQITTRWPGQWPNSI